MFRAINTTRTDGRAVQGARLRSTSSSDEHGIWSLRGREFESHSVQIFLAVADSNAIAHAIDTLSQHTQDILYCNRGHISVDHIR
jgi:hypothetical protein